MHVLNSFICRIHVSLLPNRTVANKSSKISKMQQEGITKGTTTTKSFSNERLSDKKVRDLIIESRRLVEVPYTASLAHTMNALVANRVVAVPVAAPPGQWIGAGGSMILESDKQTGAVRKHYIGMVTMLDILAHIAGDDKMNDGYGGNKPDLDMKMAVPVSSIIGYCLEGLNLWTLNPNTSILDCMEVFSKGIHRALVPLDGQMRETVCGVELVKAASTYRMLTQMDLLRFLKDHVSELQSVLSRSVGELGAVNPNAFAITSGTKVIDTIKCMKTALLNAVPVVEASGSTEEESTQLINGIGRRLIGTFSATDLKGCHLAALQTWLPLPALEFTEQVSSSPLFASTNASNVSTRELITCHPESPLVEAIDKAVTKHVHRVWVVDRQGLLVGLVSLTDIIRVLRSSMLFGTQQT